MRKGIYKLLICLLLTLLNFNGFSNCIVPKSTFDKGLIINNHSNYEDRNKESHLVGTGVLKSSPVSNTNELIKIEVQNTSTNLLLNKTGNTAPLRTFIIGNYTGSGSTITVPLMVKNFINIEDFQFSISWDTTNLLFTNYTLPNTLVGLNKSCFNATSQKGLGIQWYDATLLGVTLPDSTVIVNINFTPKNGFTGITSTYFGNVPVNIGTVDTTDGIYGIPGTVADTLLGGTVNVLCSASPSTVTRTICPAGLPYHWNGVTFTVADTQIAHIITLKGCDSAVTMILNVKSNPVTQNSTISACNSVVYNGVTYISSIIHTDTLKTVDGCDSIYKVVTISINKIVPVTYNFTVAGCNSVVYKGNTYISSTILKDTAKSVQGCDSIYNITTITVTKITPTIVNVAKSGCNSVLYNGITYNTTTIHTDTTKSIQGCDSIYTKATITVTKITPTTINITRSGCNSVLYNGITYKISTIHTDTIKSIQGCDSVYSVATISVTKITPTTINVARSGCNSVLYNGITYKISTIHTDTIKSMQGCDSVYTVATITVTKITPITINVAKSGCNSVLYNGITYKTSTIHTDTIRSIQGCDSVYTVATITIFKITPTSSNLYLSNCDSVVYKSFVFKNTTIYYDTVRTNAGCDSEYITVNITVNNLKINGNIITAYNKTIPNVALSLTGTNSKNGIYSSNYAISCLPNMANEKIQLFKNNDIFKTNGLTVFDISLIQAHILGKTLLNSPYKLIAADVNGDGNVTALDIVYMKRLILGIDTTFTNVTTKQTRLWTFVDSSYIFPDTIHPFPFKDSINFIGLIENKTNQTFIGCKLGDVNWDWNQAIARPGLSSNIPVELSYDPLRLGNEKLIRIPVKVKNFKDLLGMQFTINFNAALFKWVGIENNILNFEIGTNHAADGKITFLWTDAKNEFKTLEDGTVVFELILNKTGNEIIDNSLMLDGSVTAVEAFDKDYGLHNVLFKNATIASAENRTENWIVAPNPIKEGLIHVHMKLNDKKKIIFKLIDFSGKLLLTKQVEGVKGVNDIEVRQGNVPPGNYFLQAIGIEGEEVKKIIVGN